MTNSVQCVGLVLFTLLSVSCASSPEPAATIHRDPDPKWSMCKVDTDCAKILGFCKVPTAVNRNYINQMSQFVEETKTTRDCKPFESVKFRQSTLIGCEKNKCTLVFP